MKGRAVFKAPATALDKLVIWAAARALRGKHSGLQPNHSKAQALLDSPEFVLKPGIPEMRWKNDSEFEFASPVITEHSALNLVRGKFFCSGNNWREKPTAILVHGWNDEFGYLFRFPMLAKKFLKREINSMFIELPFHLSRRPVKAEGIPRDFISEDLFSTVRAAQQSLADIRSLIAWLEKETRGPIGMWGVSLGGLLTGILLKVEERISCAVLMIPVCDLERAFCELKFCEPIKRSLETGRLDFEKLAFWNTRPLVQPSKILLVESQYDLFAPKDTIEKLWESWGKPDIRREKHGHISILFSRRAMEQTTKWVAEHLTQGRG